MEDIVYEIVRVIGRNESRNLSRAGISLQIGIVLYSRSRRRGKDEIVFHGIFAVEGPA